MRTCRAIQSVSAMRHANHPPEPERSCANLSRQRRMSGLRLHGEAEMMRAQGLNFSYVPWCMAQRPTTEGRKTSSWGRRGIGFPISNDKKIGGSKSLMDQALPFQGVWAIKSSLIINPPVPRCSLVKIRRRPLQNASCYPLGTSFQVLEALAVIN